MTALQEFKVARLRDFRSGIYNLPGDLTYIAMEQYLVANRGAVDAVSGYNQIIRLLAPYRDVTDLAVLEAVRQEIAGIVDQFIRNAQSQQEVRSVLQELVLKVKDAKLSALLNEFDDAKHAQPNLAAIGFRTIMCLVIQQRARKVDPNLPLSKRTDLEQKAMLDEAITTRIFGDGLTKLLDAYRRRGLKERFDNVVHKPDANMLVSKEDLSAAVDLLNSLLPSVI